MTERRQNCCPASPLSGKPRTSRKRARQYLLSGLVTKELLGTIVTRIELFYDHEETEAGRKTSTFTHGLIYLRPDAGESWGTDPKSTLMIKRPQFDAPANGSRYR